jgi:hypothetical protein
VPPTGSSKGDGDGGLSSGQRAPRRVQITDAGSGGWLLQRPASTPERLIVPFIPSRCCVVGPGLPAEFRDAAPAALAARGVKDADWAPLAARLERDVQRFSWSICGTIAAIVSIVGLPFFCSAQGR